MLKKIVLGLLMLVVALAAVGMLLPGKVHCERSTVIAAGPEAIMPLVEDLRRWPDWTVWSKEGDPTVEFTYVGERGKDASYSWSGKKFGKGKLTITKSDPQTGIEYDLYFDEEPTPTKGYVKFEKANEGQKVTWGFDGEMGMNPISRWFGLFLDRMLGPDFEKGLAKLKTLAEKK